MTLKEHQEQIEAAEALVTEAKEAYREAAMSAFEEGRLEEIIYANWREIYGEAGVKVYCDACFSISPQGLRHERCPHCGARMRNAQIVYHKVQRPSYLKTVIDKMPQTEEEKAEAKTTSKKKSEKKSQYAAVERKKDIISGIIAAFHNDKVTYKALAELTGLKESNIQNWAVRQSAPRDAAYTTLVKAYKDYFGKEYKVEEQGV